MFNTCVSVFRHLHISFHILVSCNISSDLNVLNYYTFEHLTYAYMYKVSFTWDCNLAGQMAFLIIEVSWLDYWLHLFLLFCVLLPLILKCHDLLHQNNDSVMLNQFHGNGSRKFICASFISTRFYRRMTSSMQNVRTWNSSENGGWSSWVIRNMERKVWKESDRLEGEWRGS